jgi:hypothetical protein
MDLTKLRKIESSGPRRAAASATGMLTATLKVKRPDYRPAEVKVRANISEHIFTADFPADALANLENDPDVISISPARSLQSVIKK